MKKSAKIPKSKKKLTYDEIFGKGPKEEVAQMKKEMSEMQEIGENISNQLAEASAYKDAVQ